MIVVKHTTTEITVLQIPIIWLPNTLHNCLKKHNHQNKE